MAFEKGHKLSRGGKRKGAGRKSSKVKALVAQAQAQTEGADAEDATANLAEIKRLAYDPGTGEKVRIQALMYLVDRKLGKPKEPREHTGGITIRIAGYDPEVAG
jgi:hypothetical protein